MARRKTTAANWDRMMTDRFGPVGSPTRPQGPIVTKKPRILITCQGGVITSVISDVDIEYVIKDFDELESSDDGRLEVQSATGRSAEAFDHAVAVDISKDLKPIWR